MTIKQKTRLEQTAAEFDNIVLALDQVRTLQIADGHSLENAKGNVYEREHERLLRKFGKEHPRTVEMGLRIKGNEKYKTAIIVEYKKASSSIEKKSQRPAPPNNTGSNKFTKVAEAKVTDAKETKPSPESGREVPKTSVTKIVKKTAAKKKKK